MEFREKLITKWAPKMRQRYLYEYEHTSICTACAHMYTYGWQMNENWLIRRFHTTHKRSTDSDVDSAETWPLHSENPFLSLVKRKAWHSSHVNILDNIFPHTNYTRKVLTSIVLYNIYACKVVNVSTMVLDGTGMSGESTERHTEQEYTSEDPCIIVCYTFCKGISTMYGIWGVCMYTHASDTMDTSITTTLHSLWNIVYMYAWNDHLCAPVELETSYVAAYVKVHTYSTLVGNHS